MYSLGIINYPSINYLGVDIDNVLSWNLQTDSISKKLFFFFFIISRLSRLKPVLPSQMLMYIYTSIIQPKIDYAISIWGYTTAHNINKVQRLQNRAARILTGNFDYVNTRGTGGSSGGLRGLQPPLNFPKKMCDHPRDRCDRFSCYFIKQCVFVYME